MNYKYNAFISYRHAEPDMTVARRLQETLERYTPPKNLEIKAGSGNGNRLRLFRDEAELMTTSDLTDEIKEALQQSEYLIVICSPHLAESKWCAEEIRIFKELHEGSSDHIIAVIAEGEPGEVFPKALTTSVRKTDAGKETVTVEPLAANLTASTEKERNEKLKKEYLRIAAPLLHTGYSSLYDRHQKRRTKRLFTIGGIILAAVITFAVTVTAMLLQIRNRNIQLTAQQEELEEQNRQITEQNVDLLRRQAETLTNQAWEKLEGYDLVGAVEDALEALKGLRDGGIETYLPAEDILSRAALIYSIDKPFPDAEKLRYNIPVFDTIQDIEFNESGDRLCAYDKSNHVYVIDTESKETILHKRFKKDIQLFRVDDDRLYVGNRYFDGDGDGYKVYALEDGRELWSRTEGELQKESICENSEIIYSFEDSIIYAVRKSDGSVMETYDLCAPELLGNRSVSITNLSSKKDGTCCVLAYCYSEYAYYIVTITPGEDIRVKQLIRMEALILNIDLKTRGDKNFILIKKMMAGAKDSTLICFDIIRQEIKWIFHDEEGVTTNLYLTPVSTGEETDYVPILCSADVAMVIDPESGKLQNETSCGEFIMDYMGYNERNTILFTSEGHFFSVPHVGEGPGGIIPYLYLDESLSAAAWCSGVHNKYRQTDWNTYAFSKSSSFKSSSNEIFIQIPAEGGRFTFFEEPKKSDMTHQYYYMYGSCTDWGWIIRYHEKPSESSSSDSGEDTERTEEGRTDSTKYIYEVIDLTNGSVVYDWEDEFIDAEDIFISDDRQVIQIDSLPDRIIMHNPDQKIRKEWADEDINQIVPNGFFSKVGCRIKNHQLTWTDEFGSEMTYKVGLNGGDIEITPMGEQRYLYTSNESGAESYFCKDGDDYILCHVSADGKKSQICSGEGQPVYFEEPEFGADLYLSESGKGLVFFDNSKQELFLFLAEDNKTCRVAYDELGSEPNTVFMSPDDQYLFCITDDTSIICFSTENQTEVDRVSANGSTFEVYLIDFIEEDRFYINGDSINAIFHYSESELEIYAVLGAVAYDKVSNRIIKEGIYLDENGEIRKGLGWTTLLDTDGLIEAGEAFLERYGTTSSPGEE